MGEDQAERVAHFRESAERCMALATSAASDDLRQKYMGMAETYLKLAQMELDALNLSAIGAGHPGTEKTN